MSQVILKDGKPTQTAFVCRRECLPNLEGQVLTLLDATIEGQKKEDVKSLFRNMFHAWIHKYDAYGVDGEIPTPKTNMGNVA